MSTAVAALGEAGLELVGEVTFTGVATDSEVETIEPVDEEASSARDRGVNGSSWKRTVVASRCAGFPR